MSDVKPPVRSARSHREISAQKPRWAFWKGALTGAAIEVPIIAFTVWLVARLGIGNPDEKLMPIMRLTAVFVGIAAVFTAGGIGRLAAYTTVERGRRRAVFVAARAHALAGAGLVVIAAIPHGHIDFKSYSWIALPAAGLVAGAVCGMLIGLVCSSQTSMGLAEVWSLTRKPSEALRTLLSPGDLIRLGAALRSRTTTLFEGIFEPAPPPPSTTPTTPATTVETTPPAPAGPAGGAASEERGKDRKKAV